jgi:monoamine oxidase
MKPLRVVVAGAGLAGLAAADALAREGAYVQVIEPRIRLGGRVWTIRDAPLSPFHAEAGGDLIDAEHTAIRALARELGLPLTRVLRTGFGLAVERHGRVRVHKSQQSQWQQVRRVLAREVKALETVDADWQSSVAHNLAGQSLAATLTARHASPDACAMAVALRGFYLADPDRLSTLVAVEQLLAGSDPGAAPMFRVKGGNDRLATALARRSRAGILLNHIVRGVTAAPSGVRVALHDAAGMLQQIDADYIVVTAPVSVVREWHFDPPLRDTQRRAFEALSYGRATKALLRFDHPWWRRRDRPRGFGTTLPVGAVWDAAEGQRGGAILTLLAGGIASAQLQALLAQPGPRGAVDHLRWLGRWRGAPPAVWSVTWESDPWARGGYAVFGPAFDPGWRFELARAHGRVVFAGEHTSRDWQGYMNGAIESGQRAAREVQMLSSSLTIRTV